MSVGRAWRGVAASQPWVLTASPCPKSPWSQMRSLHHTDLGQIALISGQDHADLRVGLKPWVMSERWRRCVSV